MGLQKLAKTYLYAATYLHYCHVTLCDTNEQKLIDVWKCDSEQEIMNLE
jgi:hypothetical protein